MTTITNTPAVTRRLMKIADVQEYLGISNTTVWRLVRDRKLCALKIGAQIRFRPADVEAYLESRETTRKNPAGTYLGHGRKKKEDGAV
ncbi:MAG: helix-turn-helix domain-containing protein [Candidatus Handelsmanbacteria bacterium]|nr:helix-turn-helix domain-containing protein [Candidatus Handelsmanbacteria bacterium]